MALGLETYTVFHYMLLYIKIQAVYNYIDCWTDIVFFLYFFLVIYYGLLDLYFSVSSVLLVFYFVNSVFSQLFQRFSKQNCRYCMYVSHMGMFKSKLNTHTHLQLDCHEPAALNRCKNHKNTGTSLADCTIWIWLCFFLVIGWKQFIVLLVSG